MIKIHLKRIGFFILAGLIVCLITILVSPKVYEAKTELLLGQQSSGGAATFSDVKKILDRGSTANADTERSILSSQGVFYEALFNISQKTGRPLMLEEFEDYYLMYDVIGSGRSKGTGVAQIQVRAYNRQDSLDIANEIVHVYNKFKRKTVKEAVNNAVAYLNSQVKVAAQALEKADQSYQDFKEHTNIADVKMRTSEISKSTSAYREAIKGVEVRLYSLNTEINEQKLKLQEIPKKIQTTMSTVENPQIGALETKLLELERSKETMLIKYHEDAEPILMLNESIQEVKSQLKKIRESNWKDASKSTTLNPLRTTIESKLTDNLISRKALIAQRDALKKQFIAQEKEIDQLPKDEIKFVKLQRERQIADMQFRRIKSQLDELKNRAETVVRSAFVLSPARSLPRPVAPDPAKVFFLGVIISICLGIVYSTILETFKLRVYNSSQLVQLTGAKVLATMPFINKSSLLKYLKSAFKANFLPIESFQYMASLLHQEQKGKKVDLITSIKTLGGSSLSSIMYARVLASRNMRVLLIDFDLQHGLLSRVAKQDESEGISDLLKNENLSNVDHYPVIHTDQPGLDFLPRGRDKNLRFYYITDKIGDLLEKFKKDYDAIVLAMPPCDTNSDVSNLVSKADNTLLAVSSLHTKSREILTGCRIIEDAKPNNFGLILTDNVTTDDPFLVTRN